MSFWKNKPLIIALILTIVLIVLLFTTSGNATDGGAVSIFGKLIAPLQEGLYTATEGISGALGGGTEEDATGLQNATGAELREKVKSLENQVREMEEQQAENERLRNLLSMKNELGAYETIAARVIGKNSGQWFRQFTVDVGTNDGIEPNMIVYTADGLMGRVISCSDTYSKISSFMDTQSGVPVLVERTRDNGIVKGIEATASDDKNLLALEYLAVNTDIVPGDTVITSGVGGIYPKGIYVGEVLDVSTSDDTENVIRIKSNVDFEHVEEVLIVKELFEEVEG